MTKVIISNTAQQPLIQLQSASRVKWRKVLNGVGYASFDLPLTDAYANTKYLHAGNYVHIYRDGVDSSKFANASWGGMIENDYEIKPKQGVVTIGAAGLAQLLQMSIVQTTTVYSGIDLGSIVTSLITNRDNQAVGLTPYSVSALGPVPKQFIAGFGDPVMADIVKLMTQYGCDFEVRPDFTWAFYVRQGVDNPNLIARYGDRGNIEVDTQMHLVNTEMANQVYVVGQSSTQFAADPTAAQYYGKKTLVIQASDQYDPVDVLTRAQLELAKRKNPLFVVDHVKLVDSSLLPFYLLHLGDRINFSTSLPFLNSFNGLQRILSIDYDDHSRTMDLTLGNAVYVVLKGKLHEVRLYT